MLVKSAFVCRKYSVWLACILSLGVLGQHRAQADDKTPQRQTAIIPFIPAKDHGVPIIEVRLNDSVVGRFIVDTGAAECCITGRLVKKLGLKTNEVLPNGDRIYMGGDSLFQPSATVAINHMQIGPIQFGKSRFVVLKDDNFLRFDDEQLDGMIGGPLLTKFALFIDYPRHSLALIYPGKLRPDEVAALGMGDAAHAPLNKLVQRFSSGDVSYTMSELEFVTKLTLQNGDKQAKDELYVDTGSPNTTISFDASKKLALEGEEREAAVTIAESAYMRLARVPSVHVGDLGLKDFKISYPERATQIPPLLGEDVLSFCNVLFDFDQHTLYLKPVLPPVAAIPATLDKENIDQVRLRAAAEISYIPFSPVLAGIAEINNFGETDAEMPLRIAMAQKMLKGDATDAEMYSVLGDLYWRDKQVEKAREAYSKAAELFQAKADANPKEVLWLSRRALALCSAGQLEEAEKTARFATDMAPLKAETWVGLGKVLHARSLFALTGQSRTVDITEDNQRDFVQLVARLRQNPPTKEQISSAQELDKAARECFNKAVLTAGDASSADAYRARAFFLKDSGLGIQATLHALRGKPGSLYSDIYTREYIADVDAVADRQPNNGDALSNAAEAEVEGIVSQGGKGLDFRNGKLWDSLPSGVRKSAQKRLDQLTVLTQSSNPALAAKALERLGLLQYAIIQDAPKAENTLRQAIQKDATRARASYTLCQILTRDKRYDEIVTLLQERVQKSDSAQDELLLARALDKLGRSQEAEEAAAKAVQLCPQSFYTNLTLATLQEKNSEADPLKKLTAASDCLDVATKALPQNVSLWQNALLENAQAIYWGLWGDSEEARGLVLKVLDSNRTDTTARDILAAVVLGKTE